MTNSASSSPGESRPRSARPGERLGVSVYLAYVAAFCLVVGPVLLLVENPVSVLANLRIMDDLADMGIVRDVDVGTGFIDGVPEVLAHSRRPISWNLLGLAFLCIVAGYAMRALRQSLLARRNGVAAEVPHQTTSYFWARGLNVLFPFGPGDFATARRLVAAGADSAAVVHTLFDARLLELCGIGVLFGLALALSGWGGVLGPYALSVVVLVGLTWAVRPLGPRRDGGTSVWEGLHGSRAVERLAVLSRVPTALAGLVGLSAATLGMELAGLYLLKQSFSTREFMMLSDLPFAGLMMALGVASLARVVPVTPGGAGFYELSMVAVFLAYGEDPITGTTVAVLDGVFTNLVALLLFIPTLLSGARGAGIVTAWQKFMDFSRRRVADLPVEL